jgi:stringent starvation protein B
MLPPKKDVALALLEESTVRIFLDPRRDGVIVPAWLRKQPQLLLDVGLNTPIPIPDLHVGDDAISCTLSFNRSPFYCVIPWTAVFALLGDGDRGMLWPDDVPDEVSLQPAKPKPAKEPKPSAPGKSKRASLRAVPSPKDDEDGGDTKSSDAPPAPTNLEARRKDKASKDVAAAKESARDKTEKTEKSEKSDKTERSKQPSLFDTESAAADADSSSTAADRRVETTSSTTTSAAVGVAATANDAPKQTSAEPSGDNSEIVEIPEPAKKRKRELPPYMRIVK